MADVATSLKQMVEGRFDQDIWPAELRLFEAVASGKDADCADLAGRDRIIRGDRLSWLCMNPGASVQVTNRGISLIRAEIEGEVSVESVKIPFPLKMNECVFAETISLRSSQIVSLYLERTSIKSLEASRLVVEQSVLLGYGLKADGHVSLWGAIIGGDIDCSSSLFRADDEGAALNLRRATVRGSVFLRNGFAADGCVALQGARIGGNLECGEGRFRSSQEFEPALDLSGAKIQGSAYLNYGFLAKGGVALTGAFIEEDLACDHGSFFGMGGMPALDLNRSKIQGSVLLRDLKADGAVALRAAAIGGHLMCEHALIGSASHQLALDAIGAHIEGSVYARGLSVEGIVRFRSTYVGGNFQWLHLQSAEKAVLDLRNAKVGTLFNSQDSWPSPGNLFLAGLLYDDIDERVSPDAKVQLQWIRRQSRDSFSPQPFEQLSAYLRTMGREEQAVKVMIAQNEDHAAHTEGPQEWLWYRVIGKAIGYGYRRGRPFLMSLIVIGIGWFVFLAGYRQGLITPTEEKAYVLQNGKRHLSEFHPKFNAFVYSLESFVPLVKLGITDHWLPNANRGESLRLGIVSFPRTGSLLRYYLWLHMIAGWVLSALWVGGITGLVKT